MLSKERYIDRICGLFFIIIDGPPFDARENDELIDWYRGMHSI